VYGWQDQDSELERELLHAHEQLERFERDTLAAHALRRLRRHAPFHPVLVLRALSLLCAALLALATLAVLLVPVVGDRQLTETLSRLDGSLPLPVGLALLMGCALLFALGAHLAAMVFGRSAPLLPPQARQHQHLVRDVQRLEAMRTVSGRLAPGAAARGYLGGQAATIPMSYNPSEAPTVMGDGGLDLDDTYPR